MAKSACAYALVESDYFRMSQSEFFLVIDLVSVGLEQHVLKLGPYLGQFGLKRCDVLV